MDGPLIVGAGLLGLLFGSFANVVIHRVPAGRSVARPGSACPSCGTPLAARDNVPIVSWLALRGRCRHCRAQISARYPIVEGLTGILFALTAASAPRATDLLAYLPFVWVLVVLAFIDLDTKLLPNRIVLPSIAAGLVLFAVAAVLGPGLGSWVRAIASGAAAFLAFLLLAIIAPRGMGMGDVKLAALLGMGLGYPAEDGLEAAARVFVGFFLAFVMGAAVGVVLLVARRAGAKTQVPFGPFLAAGAVLGVIAGGPLVRLWLGPLAG